MYGFFSVWRASGGSQPVNQKNLTIAPRNKSPALIVEIMLFLSFSLAGAVSGFSLWNHFRDKLTISRRGQKRPAKTFYGAKSEIESLQFEKSMISHSIVKIYETFQNGNLPSIDRDRLLLKYKTQVETFNKKIGELQMRVDLTELSDMRSELVSLLRERIASIDARLSEISQKFGDRPDLIQLHEKREYPVVESTSRGSSSIFRTRADTKTGFSQIKVEEKKIQKVQNDILEALARLEAAGETKDNNAGLSMSNPVPVTITSNPYEGGSIQGLLEPRIGAPLQFVVKQQRQLEDVPKKVRDALSLIGKHN